jgi:hypothetical protein
MPEEEDIRTRGQQGELDKEHAFANLDQTIGDREQALEDVEQGRLDESQVVLDRQRQDADTADGAGRLKLEHGQRDHGLAQARRDARQEQLDQGQTGRDRRQALLDVQQQELESPASNAVSEPQTPASAVAERIRLAGDRAKAARRRATEAVQRAEEAEVRLEALARRHEQ